MLNRKKILIFGLFGTVLLFSIKSAQADVPIGGWKRVSGTQVTTEQAAKYYVSNANTSVIEPGKFTVLQSSKDVSLSSELLSVNSIGVTGMSVSASATSILNADEVADLARALNHDPLLIYNFVRNNIDYAPYLGYQKGAKQTLIDRTGSDFDQAALMVELLRDSGYSAQYLYGVMSIPRTGLANWLGVDPTFTRIQKVLSDGNIPNGPINTADDTLDVYRIFVQVTIDGTDYVFDPAYKQYDYKTGINIADAISYSQADLLNAVNSGATISTNYVQNLNETNLRNKLNTYSNSLISTLRSQYPNAEVSDIIGGRKIRQSHLANLQTSLPFPVTNTGTWPDVPTEFGTTIEIQYNGIHALAYSSQITGKRLAILFPEVQGSPRYSYHIPCLYLDDTFQANGSYTETGASSTMTITVTPPYLGSGTNPNISVSTYSMRGGASYAIISDFGGGVGDVIITKRQQVINEGIASGYSYSNLKIVSETLNVLGLTWLKEFQATEKMIDYLAETVRIRHHSIGVVAQEAGYYVNLPDISMSVVSQHDGNDNWPSTVFSVSGFGSAYEHGILEQMTGSDIHGISTVKIFQLAVSLGMKIYSADSSNFASIQQLLSNYTSAQISEIQEYINSGHTVYLPENGLIGMDQWKGTGYYTVKTAPGQAKVSVGFLINGKYFGGYSSFEEMLNGAYVRYTNLNNYPEVNQTTVPTAKSADPVDMTTGAFVHDHLDLSLGGQAPLGLSFSRSYLSSSNLINKMLGYGWTHSYDIRVTKQSNADPVLGFRTPVDAASLITSVYIALDLMSTQNNLQGWTTSSLIQKWAADQMVNNSVNVNIGSKVLTYIKLTDGTYSAPPGVTTALIDNGNGTFSLKERFGTTINFDTNSRVTSLSDIDGNNMSFTYSGDLLSKVTDQFGRFLNFTYNGEQLISVSDSADRSVSYGYDANNNLTSFTDTAGKVWQYGYEGRHRMTTMTNPLGIQTIANTYDDLGQVMTQVAPRQAGETATYNFYFTGVRNSTQAPLGKFTIYNLDDKSRTVSVINEIGAVSSQVYDGQDHAVITADPLGNQTTFTYNRDNDLVNTRNALGNSTVNTYDEGFHLVSVTDPLNNQTKFNYDAKHHLLSSKDPLNNMTSSTYLPNGFLADITDQLNVVTAKTYDAYGNPLTSTTASHPPVITTYNSVGQLLSLQDQVGATTSFQYDNRGLLTRKTDPLGKETVFTYDDAGRLVSVKDRNDHTITYTYTPTDEIDTITYPDASTVKCTYDLNDRLIKVMDPLGATNCVYDDANRITNYTNAFGMSTSYEYDLAGNVTKLTYPDDKAVTYTYDALNRLKTVTNWLSQTATYSYDDAGRLTSLVNFNGSITTYAYDDANRMVSLVNKTMDTGDTISSYSYVLDGIGNRIQVIQSEQLPPSISAVDTQFLYNSAKNRLLSVGPDNFTYDNEGQISSKASLLYVFDYEHRLKTIGGDDSAQFKYDCKGNRLEATRNGVVTRYLYDLSGNLLAETDSSNIITKYYIYGRGLLAMITQAGQAYTYHYNGVGSTIAMSDKDKKIINKYFYTPFGDIAKSEETVPQPFKYVGQYGILYEPNGLYYMRARYYDPNVSRFISEDPRGFGGGDVNLHVYVGNNPITYIDPLGLSGTLYIHSTSDGDNSLSGHSWIEYRNDNGNVTTYGTFGNNMGLQGVHGLNINTELGHIGQATRSANVNDVQEVVLYGVVSKYASMGENAWTYLNPCSSFASSAWNATTGENLSSRSWVGISNPANLTRSINERNSLDGGHRNCSN